MATENQTIRKLGTAVESVVDDYDRDASPFREHKGLTERILEDFETDREKALFHTLVTALNFQRDAEVLYGNFDDLWDDEHWIFEPEAVVEEHSFEELDALFGEVGTRMGTRDAKIWYEISRTLYHDHNSDPIHLFERFDYNMDRIGEYVQEASGDTRFFDSKFPYLAGDKIRPLWLRNIHREVRPLAGEEMLHIPVDVQIQKVTNAICGTDYDLSEEDKEAIREFWWEVCEPTDITPADLDSPFWRIGKHWEDWGRDYLQDELNVAGLELGEVRPSDE